MYLFDASSIIHAWYEYPEFNFPPLWDWLSQQIDGNKFLISKTAFNEVEFKSSDCSKWLSQANIDILEMSNDILQTSSRVKGLLNITNDNYHVKGVDENDIFIISTAKENGLILVSNEGKQIQLPQDSRKYKIPAVCGLTDVAVECINFVDLIKESNVQFI